ncbi:MAG TPA: four helix bundle protein [Acidobacteriota bacterium]|nr:four helix bundle protein [Acidobacteriota bacterium]
MDADELKRRTQVFALNIIRFVQNIPSGNATYIIGRQLLRCGTSVGANYRAACRAKSRPDFIAKLKIVEEECDESIYWLELLSATQPGNESTVRSLIAEANQILSIIVASIRTARAVQNRQS